MKKSAILLFILIYSSTLIFANPPTSIYIRASQVNCQGLEYDIEVIYVSYKGSDWLVGGFPLSYGDGTYDKIDYTDFEVVSINSGYRKSRYLKKHSYPGPGVYTISLRIFNRYNDINNMAHSVNTPLFIETTIILDPFLGCNSTPELENMPFGGNKTSKKYFYDMSFIDEEKDSLSFQFTTPKQDVNLDVIDYWLPEEKQTSGVRRISKISLDPYNATLLWNSKELEGMFNVAVKVNEWRKVEGVYYLISSTIIDDLIILFDTENRSPELSTFSDTVIIVDQEFNENLMFSDPDNDSIQIGLYSEFFNLIGYKQGDIMEFLPSPIEKSFRFTPKIEHLRIKPYKAVFSVWDKNDELGSLFNSSSAYIWITDRTHEPEAPQQFFGQALATELVVVYWNDSGDELGYIIERSDEHFPKFERIAVLPPNTTYFNDSSVVENTTYHYRITAVGTKMADYNITEVTTPDIVTAIDEDMDLKEIKIYPNPNHGSFTITNIPGNVKIEIRDLTGKLMWNKNMLDSYNFVTSEVINTHISKGTYILTLRSDVGCRNRKVIIH